MAYTPEHLQPWSDADPAFGSTGNYVGADFTGFYLAPVSISRDTADSVTLSNWQVVTAELEGLVRHDESGITRMGHWACGWYEIFLIHASDTKALERADQWACDLENYCVADESHLSEFELTLEQEEWERSGERDWREAIAKALERYAPEDADLYWASELADTISDEKLWESWHELTEHCGWHAEHREDGCYFNIEEPAELLTAALLSELTGTVLLAPDQQWRAEPYPWLGSCPSPLVIQ